MLKIEINTRQWSGKLNHAGQQLSSKVSTVP